MRKMEQKVEWLTATGQKVTVVVELQLEREINLDGDKSIVPCCKKAIKATVEGMGEVGSYMDILPKPITRTDGVKIVATIGKLGLTADHYSEVQKAIDIIESTDEWKREEKRIREYEADSEDYERHYKRMQRAMAE